MITPSLVTRVKMALEVSYLGEARTAPAGLRHFYGNTSRNSSSQNGFVLDTEKSIEIDYELLMTNVENMLIADKARLMKSGMKPKDLMVKSNPGLFGNMHQDITNPRDMYNFLSKRKFPKIADDDLSFNRHNTMFEDRLTRSNSFRDLEKSSNAKIQKKYHFHSHQDLSLIEKKDPSVVALNSNTPYVGPDDMARLPEREKTMMTNFNLPSLRPGGTDTGKEAHGGANNSVSLPVIRSAPTDIVAKNKRADDKSRKGHTSSSKSKTTVTFSNKIDKWFSEMPSEVTNKADRAIMEDIIREKMVAHQNEFRYRDKISKLKRQNTYLKSINQIQHQYLELRADTAPRPNRTTLSIGQYKPRHKTSLNLKSDMIEMCDKQDKMVSDTRSHNQTKDVPFDEEMAATDIGKAGHPGLNGLKKIDLDQFAVDAYKSNPNRRFSFAYLQNDQHSKILYEINEDAMRRKADKEHWLKMNQPIHPSIVNICIEKGNKENTRNSQLNQTLSVVKMDTIKDETCQIQPEFKSEDNNSSSSVASFQKRKGKSLSKTALSKFNTLEVFGGIKNGHIENGFSPDSTMFTNPLVKLDLRKTRPQIKPPKELYNTANGVITRQPQEMATVDFRFGSGEVVITRKSNGDAFNSVDIEKLHSPNAPPNNSENSGPSIHSNIDEQNNDTFNTSRSIPHPDENQLIDDNTENKVDDSQIQENIVDNSPI